MFRNREFLEPGAPCEINIDGKTMEKVQQGLKAPSRFTFDVAAEHVYTLLLKKDCYPRFIRSEHYKNLLANAIQPSQKKRFFNFGGQAKKKASTTVAPNPALLTQVNIIYKLDDINLHAMSMLLDELSGALSFNFSSKNSPDKTLCVVINLLLITRYEGMC